MDARPARRGIQSVEVAAGVLEALTRSRAPLTLSVLAREAGVPAAKAHRYLVSLIQAGLVQQDTRTGRYDLGPAAVAMGVAAISRSDPVNAAADTLRSLSLATHTTAMLSIWANHGPTVVRWERSADVLVASLGLGSILPLLSSATGMVFLAFLPRNVTAQVLTRELESGHGKEGSARDIDPLIARTRKAGYATVDGRFIPGLHAIAAPVLNWQGEADAVITLVGTAGTADTGARAAIVSGLKATCKTLSRTSDAREEPSAS